MKYLGLIMTLLVLAGCSTTSADDADAQQVAADWADAYFNCDYVKAKEYVTAESERWLRFAASNTTEADLELLRERPAMVSTDDYFPTANDTLRFMMLTVSNYLMPTPPHAAPQQADEEGTFLVTLVKRDRRWQVRMEGLPRSEKQSRD